MSGALGPTARDQSSGLGVQQPPLPPLVLGLFWSFSEGRCTHRQWSHMDFVKLVFFFFNRAFFIQKNKNVFQPHTGGVWVVGRDVCPSSAGPQPMWFGQQ